MHSIVIFGASGDLTGRKLIPALYHLFLKKRLPAPINIVGFARTAMDDGTWRNRLAETTARFAGAAFSGPAWEEFAPLLHYHAGDMEDPAAFVSLARYLDRLEEGAAESGSGSGRLYYLATAPKFYGPAAERLGQAGLALEGPGRPRRIVIEKPFGTDLASAQRLNETVHGYFGESQIYRIDHYLGKETVNNVLVLRFANAIFEPIWNRNYIESIQITANEDMLVGRRAPYYEGAGVLRDMFQNHLLQLLSFVTMEPPARFDAKAVRDEKVKVLQSIRAMTEEEAAANSIRGQYRSYRDEEGVAKTSRTATFGALRLFIDDNWRWKGVPVFLRSGKGMGCRTTQVLINFREPPHSMFQSHAGDIVPGNQLLIQIQPAEGIQLYFATKIPDTDMKIRVSELNFNFRKSFQGEMPDSYERLLLDALSGDASLFARSDEVEAAWRIIDPVQKVWAGPAMGEPEFYETGSAGPVQGDRWIESFGESWFNMCPIV
jgi:glucose-6-phosphate 1-dehydrogenase